MYFFEYLHFSEYGINAFISFWLRKWPSTNYIRNCWEDRRSSKIGAAAYRGRGVQGVSRLMYLYALTLSLFMFLAAFVSCRVLLYL